jgi:hypothetical protein
MYAFSDFGVEFGEREARYYGVFCIVLVRVIHIFVALVIGKRTFGGSREIVMIIG